MGKMISLLVLFILSFVVVSMAFSSPYSDGHVGRLATRKMVRNGREVPLGAHEGMGSVKVSGNVRKASEGSWRKKFYQNGMETKQEDTEATAPGHSPGIGHKGGIQN